MPPLPSAASSLNGRSGLNHPFTHGGSWQSAFCLFKRRLALKALLIRWAFLLFSFVRVFSPSVILSALLACMILNYSLSRVFAGLFPRAPKGLPLPSPPIFKIYDRQANENKEAKSGKSSVVVVVVFFFEASFFYCEIKSYCSKCSYYYYYY